MSEEQKDKTGTGVPEAAADETTVPLSLDGPTPAARAEQDPLESDPAPPSPEAEATPTTPAPTTPARGGDAAPAAAETDAAETDAPEVEPPATTRPDPAGSAPPADADAAAAPVPAARKLTPATVMIAVLVALLGFTLVVQVKNNSADPTLGTARQEDLVRILSDLEAREERLRQDIAILEESQRQLTSGAQGRQAALQEATRRGDDLGILAGTLPARGPGLTVRFASGTEPTRAAALVDAVQELRGAGAEAMQIAGGDGSAVRVIASTYFLDAAGGVNVGGQRMTGPYTITVIGDPKTMRTALNIPGGVVASVTGDGGNVTVQEHEVVDVTARSKPKDLQHARPVS